MQPRPLSIVAGFISVSMLIGCSSGSNNVACQNPPPQYRFGFVTVQGQPLITDSLQASSLRLTYLSTSGLKTVVPQPLFRPVPSNDAYRYSYVLSYELVAGIVQPQQYAIELNGQPAGTLRLAAQQNDGKCDKWMHLTDVQANQKPVSIGSDNVTYQITVER